MRRHAIVVLAAPLLLGGCDSLVGIFDHKPPSLVERDGLSYQLMVSESPYDRDVYEYRVRVTNTSRHTIEARLPGACMVTPRVYREGHWGRPVWEPCHWDCGCRYRDDVWLRLRPGEAVEGWWGEVWAGDILAGRHRGGSYYLAADIETGRHRFEVLGLPELWLW